MNGILACLVNMTVAAILRIIMFLLICMAVLAVTAVGQWQVRFGERSVVYPAA